MRTSPPAMHWEKMSWKAGIAGTVIGAMGLLFSIWTYLRPPEAAPTPSPSASALAGTWKGTTASTSDKGTLIFEGHTRLYPTGEYSFSGEAIVRTARGGQDAQLRMTASAAGTWHATADGFVITAHDIKTLPTHLSSAGRTQGIDVPAHWLPRLEDVVPKGSSQAYAVVRMDDDTLEATGNDIRGNLISYSARRLE